MRRLVNMRLPVDLLARVDERAGHLGQTRTMFVERALESALDGSAPKGAPGEDARVSPDRLKSDDSTPAPSRASKKPSLAQTWSRPTR